MPSTISRLLPSLFRLLGYKRVFASGPATLDKVDQMLVRPPSFGPPRLMRRDVRISVRHDTGWPIYLVEPRGSTPTRYAVYAHGGAWINQIHPLQWRFIAAVAAGSGTAVTVPIYPLAPLGTAGNVVPAFADLLQNLADRHGGDRVSVIGDSAGGQIALSAALLLRERGAPPLHRTVLISPSLDLTFANPEIDAVEPRDPWLARPGPREAVELWRGKLALDDVLVSPLFAELQGLGPLAIFSGTLDITNPDTRLLVTKAREAGVPVDFHESVDLIHVYPLLPIPEGREALREINRLLSS